MVTLARSCLVGLVVFLLGYRRGVYDGRRDLDMYLDGARGVIGGT